MAEGPYTPDRFPGERREEEGLVLEDQGPGADPTEVGGARYVDGEFRMRDAIGVFNPRDGIPPATAVGQVLYSLDGTTFTVETPIVSCDGWLASDDGILIVCG